ncbi:hypothetical protein SAMN02745126_03875 [Enhydrobacter aerosaccus]|uniref:Uncharacterized protein n=1 Tax=Enhydrobacter aerosaccus TaxID=225324 RepID=A0A1T4RK57_9HYPH|nr:hypothetical protein [Enhydrobacter aerosaccus]SKA16362.1 hypothetical protein SAMN02745126_03875 [Enhydrobacter aerosaccus]
MTRSTLFATASLLAAICASFGAHAQTGPARPSNTPASTSSGAPPSGGQTSDMAPGSQMAPEGVPLPILFVTSVEVLRSARDGGMDIVRARGLVTSNAWSAPRLLPINAGPTVDGVLDLIFQGNAPQMPSPLGSFMEVEALLPIAPGHPYKAVRVRSSSNAVTLKTIPGFVETKFQKTDCATCVGKYFVAKGQAAPANVPAADIVRQEDLPGDFRVIRPDQGIPNYVLDPNRLTLVLTEDGRISDAGWD